MKIYYFWALCILVCPVRVTLADINGPLTPCQYSKARYTYCRTENFPYHWHWSVTNDASVVNLGTHDNCYYAEVTLGKQGTTLTFHQSNPPEVPPVYNEIMQIYPKKCTK